MYPKEKGLGSLRIVTTLSPASAGNSKRATCRSAASGIGWGTPTFHTALFTCPYEMVKTRFRPAPENGETLPVRHAFAYPVIYHPVLPNSIEAGDEYGSFFAGSAPVADGNQRRGFHIYGAGIVGEVIQACHACRG
jgi:hypothetical protein